jgi:predicted N-acetyltransferase YhbS
LAVHPEYQNSGIGGQLINEGIKRLREAGVDLVFVLGHPGYYPKYGFSAAGVRGLAAPYPIAPENSGAWMVQEIHPGVFGRVSGRVVCADALNDPRHWRE